LYHHRRAHSAPDNQNVSKRAKNEKKKSYDGNREVWGKTRQLEYPKGCKHGYHQKLAMGEVDYTHDSEY
jgi:hypothetical protein